MELSIKRRKKMHFCWLKSTFLRSQMAGAIAFWLYLWSNCDIPRTQHFWEHSHNAMHRQCNKVSPVLLFFLFSSQNYEICHFFCRLIYCWWHNLRIQLEQKKTNEDQKMFFWSVTLLFKCHKFPSFILHHFTSNLYKFSHLLVQNCENGPQPNHLRIISYMEWIQVCVFFLSLSRFWFSYRIMN